MIGEMALAVTLVIGAGLLIRSFSNLMSVDAGFDRSHLTTFSLSLPPRVYRDSVRRVAFYDNVLRQLAAVPGVRSTAAMSGLPPQRSINANDTDIDGYVPGPGEQKQPNIDYYQYATPNYFTTMRIPIVAGRGFGPQDGPLSPPVALINEALAKRYYGSVSPVGRRIQPGGDSVWFTVIGVAKDVKQAGVSSKTGTELYLDYQQLPRDYGYAPAAMYVVVRADLDKAALAPSIRKVVSGLDASLPIVQLRSMDEVFGDSVSQPHFIARLLAVFALVALVLSAVGTYGVVAYSITERVREIGIRMALGASAERVLGMVLRQGLGAGRRRGRDRSGWSRADHAAHGDDAVWREADRRRDVCGGGGLDARRRVRGGVRAGAKGDEGRSIDRVESRVNCGRPFRWAVSGREGSDQHRAFSVEDARRGNRFGLRAALMAHHPPRRQDRRTGVESALPDAWVGPVAPLLVQQFKAVPASRNLDARRSMLVSRLPRAGANPTAGCLFSRARRA